MTTAHTIIGKSLRMIGVLASGDAGTAAEYADALDGLNSIIDGWSVDPNFYFCEQGDPVALSPKSNYCIGDVSVVITSLVCVGTTATATTNIAHSLETGNKVIVSGAVETNYNVSAPVVVTGPSTFTYTIVTTTSPATGATVCKAGDMTTIRPISILGAFTRAGSVDSPLALITESFWNNISNKAATAAIPTKLLYRTNYPFGQIVIYPVPTGNPVLYVKSEKFLTPFAALEDDKLLPPGYRRLLELALAVDLSSEYGAKVGEATVVSIKASYQSLLDSNNQKPRSLKLPVTA